MESNLSCQRARKTHILYRCNLNSIQMNENHNFILDRGMLKMVQEHSNSKRHIFKTSGFGNKFIRKYKLIAESFKRPLPLSVLSE